MCRDGNMSYANGYDNYWRQHDSYDALNKREVSDRLTVLGFDNLHNSRTKIELISILRRHDLGRFCYDKYSDKELLDRLGRSRWKRKVRRLADGTLPQAERMRLIEMLQNIDDEGISFRRFLDLPAELRNRVYEFYVEDFPRTLALPTKPPLARTCRLLRQEVLPVFYARREFEIHLTQDRHYANLFFEDHATELFLFHLAPADVACVQRLKLVMKRVDQSWYTYREDLIVSCQVDLMGIQGGLRIITVPKDETLQRSTTAHVRLRECIKVLVDGLQKVAGRKVLTLQAIHGLRGAVEKARLFS